jgi:NADPH:quinone reductase-like Zn-dependent oxidoreductase
VLTSEVADTPAVGDNHILVRQAPISVNPFDAAMRAGYLAQFMPLTFPAILGTDISGTVEAVGSAVTEFSVGDEVWARGGTLRDGAYAELPAGAASEASARPVHSMP